MKSSSVILALALALATQAAARADSPAVGFRGPDHVDVAANDIRAIASGDANLEPVGDRAKFTAVAVTILLTVQGQLIRLPDGKPMPSMAECRAWTHQQEFMRVLPGYLAIFNYCDYASEP